MSNSQDSIEEGNSAAQRKHTMSQKINALRDRKAKIQQANDAALSDVYADQSASADAMDLDLPPSHTARPVAQPRKKAGSKRGSESPTKQDSSGKRKSARGRQTAAPPPSFTLPSHPHNSSEAEDEARMVTTGQASTAEATPKPTGKDVKLMREGVVVEMADVLNAEDIARLIPILDAFMDTAFATKSAKADLWLNGWKYLDQCMRTVLFTAKGVTSWTGIMSPDMDHACKSCPFEGKAGSNNKTMKNPCIRSIKFEKDKTLLGRRLKKEEMVLVMLPDGKGSYFYMV